MPRIPRGWPAVHPQAHRPANLLSYRPGWRGSGQQPIARVPIAQYTRRVTQVPLNGGQAQGIVPGITPVSGSVTSPGTFTAVAGNIAVPPGVYVIDWSVTLSGTIAAAEADNFIFFGGPGGVDLLATSVNAAAAGTYPQAPLTITVADGDLIGIATAGTAPTAGAVYAGVFSSVGQPLTLQVGPQGMGTTWYPIQVTTTTSTGALDVSTAYVYLGPSITPATQVGIIGTGNGTAALAIPSMSPGQTLIVQWLNGHPGDTASMNIIGTMDALAA